MSSKRPAERLREWIDGESNVAETARALDVSRQTIYNWTDGSKAPSIEHTLAIERLTGIPPTLWLADTLVTALEAEEDDGQRWDALTGAMAAFEGVLLKLKGR